MTPTDPTPATLEPTGSPGTPGVRRRRAVNLRSVILGLLGVCFICGLTPYNDFVVANTFLVGNFMPVGLLLFFLAFVMLVNAPLWRWRPSLAFTAGELAVALGMTLVSCSLPSSGLMRYLPSHLVNVFHHANENPDWGRTLSDLKLPDWAFPTFAGDTVRDRAGDDVVKYFRTRIPAAEDRWGAVLGAWVTPAITWGALSACILGAVLCGSVIVRRQWVENERLAFPLASVYLSLIESPPPGRGLNTLFRSRAFWIAAVTVFVIHGFNAMFRYDGKHWPEIPVKFDLGSVLSDAPWKYMDWGLKVQTLYFCIVGFAYFLQTNVAFSIWFFYAVLLQVTLASYGTYGATFDGGRQQDLWLGGLIPFALTVLWVGRGHWASVGRQMVGRARANDARGRYLPYAWAGWGLAGCVVGMVVWLVAAGASLAGAASLVVMLGLVYLVLARIVAETGLVFVQLIVPMNRPWVYMLQDLPGDIRTTQGTHFWTGMVGGTFGHDIRESLPPFATHALRVADAAEYDDPRAGRGYGFFACLALALVVGFVVAGASMLYVEYAYATPLAVGQGGLLNGYAADGTPKSVILGPTYDFQPPGMGPKEQHNHLAHVGVGAGISGALSVLRLRFVGWPLHPVGFLTCFSYPMDKIWFSVFIGWLAKALVVRFGGSNMFRQAKPLFIGLILGEAAAASFWLVTSLVLNAMGIEYQAINLLPT